MFHWFGYIAFVKCLPFLTNFPQVLGAEEQAAGLQQPTGIGQRPKPMPSEEEPRASVKNPKNSPQRATNTTNDGYEVILVAFTLQCNWRFCYIYTFDCPAWQCNTNPEDKGRE